MPNIFLIDDDPAVLKLAGVLLRRADYTVEEYTDPMVALGRALASPPDLIVCDLQMPGLDGFGLLSALRAQPQSVSIPVIFLTSHTGHDQFRKAMRLGADDFLAKPVNRDELLQAVASRLQRLELIKSAKWPILGTEAVAASGPAVDDAPAIEPPGAAADQPKGLRELGGYVFESRIAKGGSATIYLARDKADGRQVALKLIELDRHTPADVLERFINEHELLERLRHPNIVPIYAQGFSDDHAYIAMEYFERGSLTGMLTAPLPSEAVRLLLRQCASGLEAAHHAGIVHRDLKPDNVMLRSNGTLALTDFGIAKDLRSPGSNTDHGIVLGTPTYMAPEQAMGKALDASCDVYSLGVMLYQMLTAQKPFPGDDHQKVIFGHLNLPVPRLPPGAANWQDLLDLMMAKLPPARPANASALIECLDQLQL